MRRNTQEELIAMKKQLLDRLIAHQLNRSQVANLMKMHPNAVSRLKKKYIDLGLDALIPKKPGPKNGDHIYNKTPAWVEDIIVNLAKNRIDLSPILLSEELFDQYGLNINQTTVWRILKRRKIRYTTEYKRWVKEKPKLYCLNTPGLELQLDASFPFGRSKKDS